MPGGPAASEICKLPAGGRGIEVTGAPHTDRTVNEFFDQVLADPTVTAIGGAVGAALVALWLAAAWWAYTDAARRTDSTPAAMLAAAWVVVSTPIFMPFALAVYALARPQHSAAEHRTLRFATELVDALEELASAGCPGCGSAVEDGWLRCPSCAGWLALPCTQCESWSDRSLAVCPYCGGEQRGPAAVEALEPVSPVGRPRRGRRPRAIMPRPRGAHGKAAAGVLPAAAGWSRAQVRDASSARPRSYAASRDASSASS
jgi:hypothetical protein